MTEKEPHNIMSGFCLHRRCHRVGWGLGLAFSGLMFCLAGLGCQPQVPDTLIGVNGPIHLSDVTAILNDPDLTDDAARRQALRDLGITDEALIDVLIQDGASL